MNDPLGVQSAVLGMLSLSQGGPNGNGPLSQSAYQNPDFFGTAESLVKHYSQPHEKTSSLALSHHPQGLPLTPPGSPEDQKKLVISNSDPGSQVKTCQNAQMYTDPNGFQNIAGRSYSLNNCPQSMPSADPRAYGSASLDELPSTGIQNPGSAGAFSPMGSASQLFENPLLARALQTSSSSMRRPRSEKKPIPLEQKDGKYFERRKRNNFAAKKSRDQRKSREDEIAMRAAHLERDNAILRAQVSTLREEAQNLRTLILQKRQRQMQMCAPPNLIQ